MEGSRRENKHRYLREMRCKEQKFQLSDSSPRCVGVVGVGLQWQYGGWNCHSDLISAPLGQRVQR